MHRLKVANVFLHRVSLYGPQPFYSDLRLRVSFIYMEVKEERSLLIEHLAVPSGQMKSRKERTYVIISFGLWPNTQSSSCQQDILSLISYPVHLLVLDQKQVDQSMTRTGLQ